MSLIKDYFQKTKKHIDDYGELTIVLIQVGAFFEVYGLKDKNDNIKIKIIEEENKKINKLYNNLLDKFIKTNNKSTIDDNGDIKIKMT